MTKAQHTPNLEMAMVPEIVVSYRTTRFYLHILAAVLLRVVENTDVRYNQYRKRWWVCSSFLDEC